MANWLYKLDLKEIWFKAHSRQASPAEVAEEIESKIKELNLPEDRQPDWAILDAMKDSEDFNEFDLYLSDLYDWEDTSLPTPPGEMQRKLCWLSTQ